MAEDLPDLQDVERRILEAMGIDVTFANNGQEAVDAAMRQSFDLILMDMQMPIMDGIEATRTLREQGSKTPIVALTGNVMQKHHDQFVAAGCNNFVTKPIENEELVAVLKQHLETTSGELLAENQPVAIISPPSSEEDITASGVGTSAVEKEVQKRFSVLLHDFGNQLMPIQSQLARDFHIRKMLKTLVKGLEEQQQKVDAGEEPLTTLGQVGAVLSEIEKTNLGDQLDRAQATTNKMAAAIKEQGQKLINRES